MSRGKERGGGEQVGEGEEEGEGQRKKHSKPQEFLHFPCRTFVSGILA